MVQNQNPVHIIKACICVIIGVAQGGAKGAEAPPHSYFRGG